MCWGIVIKIHNQTKFVQAVDLKINSDRYSDARVIVAAQNLKQKQNSALKITVFGKRGPSATGFNNEITSVKNCAPGAGA